MASVFFAIYFFWFFSFCKKIFLNKIKFLKTFPFILTQYLGAVWGSNKKQIRIQSTIRYPTPPFVKYGYLLVLVIMYQNYILSSCKGILFMKATILEDAWTTKWRDPNFANFIYFLKILFYWTFPSYKSLLFMISLIIVRIQKIYLNDPNCRPSIFLLNWFYPKIFIIKCGIVCWEPRYRCMWLKFGPLIFGIKLL